MTILKIYIEYLPFVIAFINAIVITMILLLENSNGASNVTEAITAFACIIEYLIVIMIILNKVTY